MRALRTEKPENGCQEFLDRLIKENPGAVAVMDEIGCGIVPVGREERLWRDLAGEAAQTLAACSRDVYRSQAAWPRY